MAETAALWLLLNQTWVPLPDVHAGVGRSMSRPRSSMTTVDGFNIEQMAPHSMRSWSIGLGNSDAISGNTEALIATLRLAAESGEVWLLDRACSMANMLPPRFALGDGAAVDAGGVPVLAVSANEETTVRLRGGATYWLTGWVGGTAGQDVATLDDGSGVVATAAPDQVSEITNLYDNPSFETGIGRWVEGGGAEDPVTSTDQAWVGDQSLHVVRGAGTATLYSRDPNIHSLLTDGAGDYTLSTRVWVPSSNVGTGEGLTTGGTGTATVTVTTALRDQWVRMDLTFTWDGSGTVHLRAFGDDATSEEYIDGIIIVPGAESVDYFDGDTPDTPTVEYAWSGTAHASSSTRTEWESTAQTSYTPASDETVTTTALTGGAGIVLSENVAPTIFLPGQQSPCRVVVDDPAVTLSHVPADRLASGGYTVELREVGEV